MNMMGAGNECGTISAEDQKLLAEALGIPRGPQAGVHFGGNVRQGLEITRLSNADALLHAHSMFSIFV